jgi:hypothetical protein
MAYAVVPDLCIAIYDMTLETYHTGAAQLFS